MIFLRYERSIQKKHRWIAMKAYGYPTRALKHSYKLSFLHFFVTNSRGEKNIRSSQLHSHLLTADI